MTEKPLDESPSSTTKATSDALGGLHGVVATVLKHKLLHKVPVYGGAEKDGTIPVVGEVFSATAAEISAAIAFLKNNNITADAATNQGLHDLSEALKNRRKRTGRTLVDVAAAQEDLVNRAMGAE
mgnify:CR=1 FL=1